MVLEAKNEQLESKIKEWKDKYKAIASVLEASSSSATQENSRLAGNAHRFSLVKRFYLPRCRGNNCLLLIAFQSVCGVARQKVP
jgi:hypothetical protein